MSFKCCDLSGDLHVQIMFVLCFANQMIFNCLSPHTLVYIFGGVQREGAGVFKSTRRENDRDLQASWTDNQPCQFCRLTRLTESPIGHDVVGMAVFSVECCCVSRSHLYHYDHPPQHQPPSGTFMSGFAECFSYLDLVLV